MGSYSPGAERRCLGEDALRAIRPPPREACLSLPAFLSVPRARDALEARAHCPSLHSEPAAAIRQLLLFPNKPRARPRSERQRTPRTAGPGNVSSIAAGRAPSSPPLLPFPTFSDGTADVPAGSSLGNQPEKEPKGPRGLHPRALPVWGGRGAEAPTAIGNRVLVSPTMPLAARLGSLGIYIIFFFFLVRQYCAFLVWFCFVFLFSFGGKK